MAIYTECSPDIKNARIVLNAVRIAALHQAFLRICLLLMLGLSQTGCSESTAYPHNDITIVIPFNSGGGFDSYVRALVPGIEKNLPNNVHVLPANLPGAGGRRGASDIYRARPDGYTIGIFNMPGVLIPELQNIPTGYDLSKVTWLSTLGYDSYVFAVKGNSPLESIDDVKNLGRTVTYGATGPGSTSYVATSIVSESLGIPYEIITGYKGSSDYLLGLIRGDFDAAMISYSTARSYLESGDIRALAVFGSDSDDPKVADAADLGLPELGQLRLSRMIGAPPGMPDDIVQLLEEAILVAMEEDDFRQWLQNTGNDADPAGAAETAAAVQQMTEFYDRFKHLLD